MKFLTLAVLIFGLFLSIILWDPDFFPKKINKTKIFFTTIWFLAPISSQPLTISSIIIGTKLIKSTDQGWLEILGGQGALILVTKGLSINQKFQIKSFNFFIFITLFFVLLFLLFIIYFNSL
jgi:hypothetical protein